MKDKFSTWSRNNIYLPFSDSIPEVHLELLARFIKQIGSRDEYLNEQEFIDKVTDALRVVGARNFLDIVKEKKLSFNRQAAEKFLKVVGQDSISENFRSFLSTSAG